MKLESGAGKMQGKAEDGTKREYRNSFEGTGKLWVSS